MLICLSMSFVWYVRLHSNDGYQYFGVKYLPCISRNYRSEGSSSPPSQTQKRPGVSAVSVRHSGALLRTRRRCRVTRGGNPRVGHQVRALFRRSRAVWLSRPIPMHRAISWGSSGRERRVRIARISSLQTNATFHISSSRPLDRAGVGGLSAVWLGRRLARQVAMPRICGAFEVLYLLEGGEDEIGCVVVGSKSHGEVFRRGQVLMENDKIFR